MTRKEKIGQDIKLFFFPASFAEVILEAQLCIFVKFILMSSAIHYVASFWEIHTVYNLLQKQLQADKMSLDVKEKLIFFDSWIGDSRRMLGTSGILD